MPITLTKSPEFNDNNDENNSNNNSNSKNNFSTKTIDKIKSAFFKIFYDYDKHLYYLIDLGVGYGTFYKIEEETTIKENSIVNIGESYLVFTFKDKRMDTEEQLNDDYLILKIYSNDQEYEPIIIEVMIKFIKWEEVINLMCILKIGCYREFIVFYFILIIIGILKMGMKIKMKVQMELGCTQMKKRKLKKA